MLNIWRKGFFLYLCLDIVYVKKNPPPSSCLDNILNIKMLCICDGEKKDVVKIVEYSFCNREVNE